MNENITDKFLANIWTINESGISDELTHRVVRCLLDYLGATVAGAKLLGQRGVCMLENLGYGSTECTVIGYQKKTSLHTASFINGFSSHTVELDDGVISGIIHPGAPVFSALLAVAEKEGVPFNKFCLGAVIGYESCVRLANAIQPAHKRCGYHASATCGLIGATLGIAAMLDYSNEKTKNAFSAAVASAHGTLKVLEDDSELKPFNVATAASDGIVAAIIGRSGFNGPNDALDGYAGFFAQNTTEIDYQKLFRKVGDPFCIEDVYVKPYAACRYVHPSIENALKIQALHHLNVEDIAAIDIRTYSLAVNKHDHTIVNNIASAKMSIPFGAAVSFCIGSANVDAYSEKTIVNKEIEVLMKKIRVIADEEFSKVFPVKSIATMKVIMKDGNTFESITDQPKGEANAPMTDEEIIQKFTSLARFAGIDSERRMAVVNNLFGDKTDIRFILKKLA